MGDLVLVFRFGHFLQVLAKPIFVPEFPFPGLKVFTQFAPVLASDMPTSQTKANISSGNRRTRPRIGQLRPQSVEDNFSQYGIGVGKELIPPRSYSIRTAKSSKCYTARIELALALNHIRKLSRPL
jgi:hypothetical protein